MQSIHPASSLSPESPSTSLQDRLHDGVEALLAQGLFPHEIECRFFTLLTADPAKSQDAPGTRNFQTTIGLSAPLSRDEASALAAAVVRALRSEPDRVFSYRMVIAHTRWNLLNEARRLASQMRREGVATTPQNLASALILAFGNAKPRSRVVSWFLDDDVVGQLITIVAADVAEEERIA